MPRPSLFQRIGLAFRAAGSMLFQGEGGFGNNWRFLFPGSQYDYEEAAGDLWRNSSVAACLRWIRVNFPEPKVEVVRDQADGQEQIQPRHELTKLLARPNKFYDWYVLGAVCVLSAVVDGNFYIRKIRSGSGKPVELWWLPHWLVRPRWKGDGTEFIGWYEYLVNGKWIRVEVEDMIHFRTGCDPRNARLGWSELKAALRAVCGLNECDTYTAAILRNMGIPGIIIGPGAPEVNLQDDDIDVIKDQFREGYTSEQRGEPMVAGRMFKVEKISMTPEELRLDKIPARLEDTIHAVIGLPAMVTGVASGAAHKTYANYGEARKAAYEDFLIPLQKSIASCLTHQLLVDFELSDTGYRVRFDYSGVQCLAEAETEVATRVGQLYQVFQVIKRSEARQELGWDFTTEDEVYYDETKPAPPAMGEGGGDADPQVAGGTNKDKDGEEDRGAPKTISLSLWRRIQRLCLDLDADLRRRRGRGVVSGDDRRAA